MRTWFLFLFISCFSFKVASQKLKSDANNIVSFKKLQDTTIVVFFNLECPISQKYTKVLREIKQNPLTKNYQLFCILSEKYIDYQSVIDFKTEYNFPLKFLFDAKKKLAKKLKANVTPQVFLLNKSGNILYSGAIDNWFYDLGKSRSQATEFYLLNAILDLKSNQSIKIKETKAIGCSF